MSNTKEKMKQMVLMKLRGPGSTLENPMCIQGFIHEHNLKFSSMKPHRPVSAGVIAPFTNLLEGLETLYHCFPL